MASSGKEFSLLVLKNVLFIYINIIENIENINVTDVKHNYCCQNCTKLKEKWKSWKWISSALQLTKDLFIIFGD